MICSIQIKFLTAGDNNIKHSCGKRPEVRIQEFILTMILVKKGPYKTMWSPNTPREPLNQDRSQQKTSVVAKFVQPDLRCTN